MAFLTVTVLPMVLIYLAFWGLSQYQMNSFRKAYGLSEQVDLLSSNCKLKSSHFTDVRFENCDLSNISFAECALYRVEFISCKLVGTNLAEATLNHLYMKDCNARYLNLSMSKINQARFSTCDLRNSDINDCKLTSIAFKNCELVESEFSHTPLRGIDLSDSHIEGIHANLPDIRGAIVNTAQAMDLTSLLGIIIKD